jgi:tetratricopeptide (TPR) repeat protein
LTNREHRSSEFRKVIEIFRQAVYLAETDSDRGELHYWLARFHGDLMEYDLSAKHYTMAKAMGAFPFECYWYLGLDNIEQELFDRAEGHLRDALHEIFIAMRAERQGATPISLKDWWQRPRLCADGSKVPPGYFLLNICLQLALVVAERGRDVARARRLLRYVDRHLHFLGEPLPTAEYDERRPFEDRQREIKARYEEHLGWVYHLDNQPRQAREHLEVSLRIGANLDSLYHLARVYLDQGAMDRARDCCARAMAADFRGLYSPRIAKIEAEASRSR